MPSAIRGWFLLAFVAFPSFSIARTIIFAFMPYLCTTIVATVVDIAAKIPNGKNGYSHYINTVFALFFFRLCFVIVFVVGASRHRRDNVTFTAMQLTNKRTVCEYTVCLVCFLYVSAHTYLYSLLLASMPYILRLPFFLLEFLACVQYIHKQP